MLRWMGLIALVMPVTWAWAQVEMTRQAATVETKIFDPKRPPNPPPPIKPPEVGCCVWDFDCAVEMGYTSAETIPGAPVDAKITNVQAKLGEAIVIWLPINATPALKAHEQGHQVIAQRVYEKSDKAIRELLDGYMGKTFQGRSDEEIGRMIQSASQELSKACIKLLGDEAGAVSGTFDELTNHNMKKDPPAEKAVEMAFEKSGRK